VLKKTPTTMIKDFGISIANSSNFLRQFKHNLLIPGQFSGERVSKDEVTWAA